MKKKKKWLLFAIISIILGTVSCSKDDDDESKPEIIDIIGTWKASSGKYDLTLKITASGYDFALREPGNGGIVDRGTYEISSENIITFESDDDIGIIAVGYMNNKSKLSLTFIGPVWTMMLGSDGVSNVIFSLSENGSENDEGSGYLIIQNLSDNYDIVLFKFYHGSGNLLGTDDDILNPDYQFTYEVDADTYIVEVTDSRDKSFKSKSFKVIADKITILGYTGTALNVLATGIEESDLRSGASLISNKKELLLK